MAHTALLIDPQYAKFFGGALVAWGGWQAMRQKQ